MRRRLRELSAMANSRHPRERALVLVACAAVLYCLWDFALMEPLRRRQQDAVAEVQRVEQQIRELEVQGERILRAHSADPNRELRERAEALQRQVEVLDGHIHDYTVTLIPPREMARFLEDLLEEDDELTLVRLENLVPEPLLDGPQKTTEGEGADSRLFRHGFVIELRGGYLNTLKYLRALEELPWNFFWEDLDYHVREYPEGQATIRAYTVSADEVWVGV